MRRIYILLICILVVGLIGKPCWGEEGKGFTVDGYEWESWPIETKSGWVFGFSEANYQAGAETYIFLVRFARTVTMKVAGTVEWAKAKEVADELLNEFVERIIWDGETYGQMVVGLNEFYRDQRNKKILTREANYVVKLKLKGAPREFIDQETKFLRMSLENRNKARKSLLERNQEYKTAFEKWGKYLPLSVSQVFIE